MDQNEQISIAHSAPTPDRSPDPYRRHVEAARCGARKRAEAMLRHATGPCVDLLDAIDAAATFHDLGKLDPDNQRALRKGRGGRLKWDHIDAGVAHLSNSQDWMAAWLVRAHHAPGLPEKEEHFNVDDLGYKLRGRRWDNLDRQLHDEQIARTDAYLRQYLKAHELAAGSRELTPHRPLHGLTMRLALSCLVDADHSDTARFDCGRIPPAAPDPRWAERFNALQQYVQALPQGGSDAERARNRRRAAFFHACSNAHITEPMAACEGPVGLGKTTAVAAYLIRRARDEGLRRLIIVAPYTNILSQTAARLRDALVLDDEQPHEVVVEHHHRADFEDENLRDLAVLWRAPVVLTTAVSFFETLAACSPAALRKLHAVPGSAIFIDEAHAALPAKLWQQNWLWLTELAERWGCRFVFASGSLARFWENSQIVSKPIRLPELLPSDQANDVLKAERYRVHYTQLARGKVLMVDGLIDYIRTVPGPRLVILNTVQNAAVVARAMRNSGHDVLHLSTALTPRDRDRIMKRITTRLAGAEVNWTLVATSLVEAGVDLSFRSAFRERFAVASTLQVGGRVNRDGEYDSGHGGVVYDFALAGKGITQHPAADISADVLLRFMDADELNRSTPADLVTRAMRDEIMLLGKLDSVRLFKAEQECDYPEVEKCGCVINDDTRLVVVDQHLRERLLAYQPVGFRELLGGSVQLWASKIEKLGLAPLVGRGQSGAGAELYVWTDAYDPDFLGIMEGVLRTDAFLSAGGGVI